MGVEGRGVEGFVADCRFPKVLEEIFLILRSMNSAGDECFFATPPWDRPGYVVADSVALGLER